MRIAALFVSWSLVAAACPLYADGEPPRRVLYPVSDLLTPPREPAHAVHPGGPLVLWNQAEDLPSTEILFDSEKPYVQRGGIMFPGTASGPNGERLERLLALLSQYLTLVGEEGCDLRTVGEALVVDGRPTAHLAVEMFFDGLRRVALKRFRVDFFLGAIEALSTAAPSWQKQVTLTDDELRDFLQDAATRQLSVTTHNGSPFHAGSGPRALAVTGVSCNSTGVVPTIAQGNDLLVSGWYVDAQTHSIPGEETVLLHVASGEYERSPGPKWGMVDLPTRGEAILSTTVRLPPRRVSVLGVLGGRDQALLARIVPLVTPAHTTPRTNKERPLARFVSIGRNGPGRRRRPWTTLGVSRIVG